jgi:hypothetical protein
MFVELVGEKIVLFLVKKIRLILQTISKSRGLSQVDVTYTMQVDPTASLTTVFYYVPKRIHVRSGGD